MIAIFCGVAMAFIQIAVINCAEEIPKRWTDNGEFNTADDCKLYQGEPYWICIGECHARARAMPPSFTFVHSRIHHHFIQGPGTFILTPHSLPLSV
jgi:hypothetical protein